MNVTIAELESYLLDHYENGGIDESLFMKLLAFCMFMRYNRFQTV